MSTLSHETAKAPSATRWPLERLLFLMAGVVVLDLGLATLAVAVRGNA